MQLSIFLFHRISPYRDPLWDPIDPKLFEQQLAFLRKRYHFVPLEDCLTDPMAYISSKPLASIVFDDGYKDFIEYAFPILQKNELPSSLYIVTDCADQIGTIWTYELDQLFWKTNKKKLTLQYPDQPLQKFFWSSPEERMQFGKKLKPQLKQVDNQIRESICTQVKDQFDDVQLPKDLYLNWEEIRQLSRAGVQIGSHTVSHPMLGNITEDHRLTHELTYSAKRIQDELGFFPKTISYPIGSYSSEVKEKAKSIGYQFGLAVNQERYHNSRNDDFEIPRIELYNETLLKSFLRASGVLSLLKKMRTR